MHPLPIAQDVVARLCHDLGGPLAALSGALDLVEVAPEEARTVLRDGAETMQRRLRLWRAAAGAGIGPMGRQGLAELLSGALANGRVAVALDGLPAEPLPAPMAQALLIAAMLAAEALPRGGTVHLAGTAEGVAVWPEGARAAWPPALAATLAGEAVPGPREVLAPLLAQLTAQAGLTLSLVLGRDGTVPPLTLLPAPCR